MGQSRYINLLMWSVTAVGGALCVYAAATLSPAHFDIRFFLLAALTLGVGARLSVKIPRVQSEVSVSDTFVFLTLLLFGGEGAVLLSAAEAGCQSLRFSRQRLTILYNAAQMAVSTSLTVWTLRLCFGPVEELLNGSYSTTFVLALFVMALVQYVTNSGLVALSVAIQSEQPFWQTWRQNFLYTSITYFAGASAAGLIAKLVGLVGFYAFIATAPIIAVVYFTYWVYLKNVEAKTLQIEQARAHVEELSHYIKEQERISQALQESEGNFRNAFDYAAIGMALVSPGGRWLQVNRSLCDIVGRTERELLETDFQSLTHPDDREEVCAQTAKLLDGQIHNYQLEQRFFHKGGHAVWAMLSVSLIRDGEGGPRHLIFQIQDITDRKHAEERLLHDALHDALTGLPNRALFMDHLRLAVERARRRESRQFAVLFLDLDRFKVINDSLGHMLGDQLLVGIARRLEDSLRPGDLVARLGGDEFTVLLEDIGSVAEATLVAERLQRELSRPFALAGREVFTTVSIGIAPSTIGHDRPENFLRDADTAMYCAKMLGKARHEVFDKNMHARAVTQLQLETDLRRAVEREEFFVQFQPIVSLGTGEIRSFEALVRWRHPEHGLISPGAFIPVAEETGLIVPLGRWVLLEACRQLRRWQQEHPTRATLSVSVNLSSKQFTQPDLIAQIRQALEETGLAPSSLKLEITESVVMENIEKAAEMLRELRALGVELSIDDFGTGYSSLSYLHRFPINTLKIDRSFVTRMSDNNENMEIVRTIVMLAHNLKMNVVAEGVETEQQLTQLLALGCGYAQGFYFSRPLDAKIATRLLDAAHVYTLPAPFADPAESPVVTSEWTN
ncbi:MAG TPA: EAL domain-containing protein [Pyrinomonadaceae bacterium]|nr:EAL domain-containing protein [Pyrinomonadaceae bacterium]